MGRVGESLGIFPLAARVGGTPIASKGDVVPLSLVLHDAMRRDPHACIAQGLELALGMLPVTAVPRCIVAPVLAEVLKGSESLIFWSGQSSIYTQ